MLYRMAKAVKSPILHGEVIRDETDAKGKENQHVEEGAPSVALEAMGTENLLFRFCLHTTATSGYPRDCIQKFFDCKVWNDDLLLLCRVSELG